MWPAWRPGLHLLVGHVGRTASDFGARTYGYRIGTIAACRYHTHGYFSGTIPCAPRGNLARVSPGMFRCAETSLGGRWLSQLASETSS